MNCLIPPVNYSYHLSDAAGEDIPVVFLHGFTGSLKVWEDVVADLTNPAVLIDLPGHGQSHFVSEPDSLDFADVVLHVKQLLEQLGYDRIHLCGYSMGGRIALALGVMFADFVESLILESASPGLALPGERIIRKDKDLQLANVIEQAYDQFLSHWAELPFFKKQHHRNPDGWEKLQKIRKNGDPKAIANALRILSTGEQPSYWDQLSKVETPVMLITGEEDQKFCNIAEEMLKQLPNARHQVVHSASHTVHLEQPDHFRDILIQWLHGI